MGENKLLPLLRKIRFEGEGGTSANGGRILEEGMENQRTAARNEMVDSGMEKTRMGHSTFVREVTAVYRGARRAVTKIKEPKCSADFIRKILPDNSREHFVALYLDGAHKVVAFSVVSTGTANSCHVHPREIFQGAILAGAVAIIVGHNHPSGDPTPSDQDISVTERLEQTAEVVGIPLIDHIVVGIDRAISIQEWRSGNRW